MNNQSINDNIYKQVSDERYRLICERHHQFRKEMDQDVSPVKVFDPLPQKFVEDLKLIREVSRYLQKKKEEDISTAAKAALPEEEKQTDEAKEVEKEDS